MNRQALPADAPEDRDGFRFRGGCAALDLTATLAGRLRAAPRELLKEPVDLDRWFKAAGFTRIGQAANTVDLDLARNLREVIYALANGVPGRSFDPVPLAILNRIAALADCPPVLATDGRIEREASPTAIISMLAREAIELLGSPAVTRVRQCQSETCAILFVDTSRAGDRRWCSMSACGNKAKVAEFRNRQRHAREKRKLTHQE